MLTDDLGAAVEVPAQPRRVVSLVPSLTEAVAISAPGMLAGATDYCVHPADLDVVRVGGSKYPSVEAVLAVGPDLVLANAEENRPGGGRICPPPLGASSVPSGHGRNPRSSGPPLVRKPAPTAR